MNETQSINPNNINNLNISGIRMVSPVPGAKPVTEEDFDDHMRESVIERAFVKAVADAGGIAYKLNSLSANGLPDRLVLFFSGKCVFVELKAPGKMMRPLQRKRRIELERLGFPVLCIDRMEQIKPVIDAIKAWQPGTEFPKGIGAKIPDIKTVKIPKVENSPTESKFSESKFSESRLSEPGIKYSASECNKAGDGV